jgi:hypothetical protein
VKAQSDILLNECADMLATKGVNNEESPNRTRQVLVPIKDDTDYSEYELALGEETLKMNWLEACSPSNTHV